MGVYEREAYKRQVYKETQRGQWGIILYYSIIRRN